MAGLWILTDGTILIDLASWIVWCHHEVHRPGHTMKHRDRATASEVTPAPVPACQYTPASPYLAGSRSRTCPARRAAASTPKFQISQIPIQFSKARTCMRMHIKSLEGKRQRAEEVSIHTCTTRRRSRKLELARLGCK
jgi:hypothetical protein